jgi:glycosyltransferase involved in cell wall biosynthesis
MDTQGDLVEEMKSYGMYQEGSVKEKFFLFWDKFILFFPSHIFTSSIQCTDILKKVSPHSNPVYLPDGISIFSKEFQPEVVKKFRDTKGKEQAVDKLKLTPTDAESLKKWLKNKNQILLYTGSYSSGKGFPDFVKKCMPVLIKNYNLRFLFGGGDYNQIPQLANLANSNPGRIISNSDLNSDNLLYFSVLGDIAFDCKPPETSESSGKILNYMAAGLPVVCFNQKNNQNTLQEGGLTAKDYSGFTRNIVKLANDPDLSKQMGDKNFERVWSEFTWDKTAQKIIETLA